MGRKPLSLLDGQRAGADLDEAEAPHDLVEMLLHLSAQQLHGYRHGRDARAAEGLLVALGLPGKDKSVLQHQMPARVKRRAAHAKRQRVMQRKRHQHDVLRRDAHAVHRVLQNLQHSAIAEHDALGLARRS